MVQIFASTPLPSGSSGDITKAGSNPTLLLASDFPIATGQEGNLYYPSRGAEGGLRIMRMLPSGETSVLATLPAAASGPLQHIKLRCGLIDCQLVPSSMGRKLM